MAKDLSSAKCTLLTIHYASEANIKALHSFTSTRPEVLTPELVLRILLTYLPESLEAREYTTYISEVASRLYLDPSREDAEVDTTPVNDIDEEHAERKIKKLKLLELKPPSYPPNAPRDALTQFLCHRALRIDTETGLLNLVPQLVEPFLERNIYLRTWYVGTVLPLLRMQFEYYPEDESQAKTLVDFQKLEGRECVEYLMKPASKQHDGTKHQSKVARDVKGLVGPWMYGQSQSKRRKLDEPVEQSEDTGNVASLASGVQKISLGGVGEEHKTGHDWEYMYRWMVHHAQDNFPIVTQAIEDWDGPGDIDLGGYNRGRSDRYLDEDVESKLEAQYAQAAFASCYAAQADTKETIQGAHGILARLAELLDFIPPPDLASSVQALPKIERKTTNLDDSPLSALEPNALLNPNHPLTTPRLDTYMLLQMMVYSAYQLSGLGHPISLINVARLHFHAPAEEQLALLQRILRGLSKGSRDSSGWTNDREKLLWLWNWGIDGEEGDDKFGAGVLGKIEKEKFEEEMLKCFTETNSYELAIDLYLKSSDSALPPELIETVVLRKATEAYDGASNGNRTRGGVKKASDILAAFRPYFTQSVRFRQAGALISATHALSFYSLTLQHGVPFQPVSIRVSQDPIGLISKVLDHNPGSYTKLDDLIDIGRNLVSAGLPHETADSESVETPAVLSPEELEDQRENAGRRITFMAIEAALREDDFETAYSYIVSRLTPSSADIEAPKDKGAKSKGHARNISKGSTHSNATASDDDISWRAAFLAGRYRPASSSPPSLRRLEQRTELLSLALLLAPVSSLTEILAAWRRCEEETRSLQLARQQEDEDFDDRADKRQSISTLPGNFTIQGEQPALVMNQKRREMGRMTGQSGQQDAPVSMFDLTRSAAQAFSKNAFPLRGVSRSSTGHDTSSMEASRESLGSDVGGDGQRVRKRDMVANAVSGGLASGIGWVLGATPAAPQQQRDEE